MAHQEPRCNKNRGKSKGEELTPLPKIGMIQAFVNP